MEKFIEELRKKVKIMKWKEITALGINMQQALKLRNGKKVNLRPATVERLKKKLKIA